LNEVDGNQAIVWELNQESHKVAKIPLSTLVGEGEDAASGLIQWGML
jgi:hypothetical protein